MFKTFADGSQSKDSTQNIIWSYFVDFLMYPCSHMYCLDVSMPLQVSFLRVMCPGFWIRKDIIWSFYVLYSNIKPKNDFNKNYCFYSFNYLFTGDNIYHRSTRSKSRRAWNLFWSLVTEKHKRILQTRHKNNFSL